MKKPKILRQPTPDDLSDLLDIHDDIIELIFEKHADKKDIAAPTMIYILGCCIHSKGELERAIKELRKVFDAHEVHRRKSCE